MLSGYKIDEIFLNIEWFGIGHIVFSYVIIGSQFIIHMKLHIGNDTHLINTIIIVYDPLCFTGVEGVWKFWVEGNYCSTTTVHHVQIWGHPQCTPADLNIPSPSIHTGARNSVFYDQNGILQGATEEINNESKIIIENIVKVWLIDRKKEIANKIKDKIKQDDKNFVGYSFHFYMLQSWLNLLFRDHPNYNSLKFFHTNSLRNRNDWSIFLESYDGNRDLSFELDMIDTSDKIRHMIETSDISYDLLKITINEFSKSFDWYIKHSVDENKFVSKPSKENIVQKQLLEAINSTIISTTNPTEREELLTKILEDLKKYQNM
jgi:hypothetical protein